MTDLEHPYLGSRNLKKFSTSSWGFFKGGKEAFFAKLKRLKDEYSISTLRPVYTGVEVKRKQRNSFYAINEQKFIQNRISCVCEVLFYPNKAPSDLVRNEYDQLLFSYAII